MVNRRENWKLFVYRDAPAASEAAADRVAAMIANESDATIALPTGSTSLIMFDILAARAARDEVDFSEVDLFCLDEYVGVTPEDQVSLTRWLREAFLQRVGLPADHVHSLPSTADDLVAAASEFDQAIAARGGLDLAVLGLGPNGHIGYNEPGSRADSRTRVVTLTPESRSQATAYWEGQAQIPDRAMTMGVGTLLEAKQIVLLVTGAAKAEMLRRTLDEPMGADVPASWLRLAGPRLTIIADEAAASEISSMHVRSPAGTDD
jgi:glucosamine-6-phosphate deaminase